MDATNPDLAILNSGGGPVYLSFAPSVPVGPTVAGNIVVMAGQTVLLTTNAVTLAALSADPLVVNAGALPSTATLISALSPGLPASVTFTRGTTAQATGGSGAAVAAETARAEAAEAALAITTVSNTYVAAGAIAITDNLSELNPSSATTYTLANGTSPGARIALSNIGSAIATVMVATYYGAATSLTINPGSIRSLYWNAAAATYRLYS